MATLLRTIQRRDSIQLLRLKKKIGITNGAYYPLIGNALPSSIRFDLIQISGKGMFPQKEHPSRVGKEESSNFVDTKPDSIGVIAIQD